MEQEIQNVMVIIRKSLEAMPEMGTEAWKLMVSGERFDGITSIVTSLLFIYITILMIKKSINIYDNLKEESYGSLDVDGFQIAFFITTLFFVLISVLLLLIMSDSVRSIVMPEYSLIRNIIDSLSAK